MLFLHHQFKTIEIEPNDRILASTHRKVGELNLEALLKSVYKSRNSQATVAVDRLVERITDVIQRYWVNIMRRTTDV